MRQIKKDAKDAPLVFLAGAKLDRLVSPVNLPLVIAELVAVVIRRDDVDEQDVFGFWVHPGQFHFVARKHSPERERGGALRLLLFDFYAKRRQLLT